MTQSKPIIAVDIDEVLIPHNAALAAMHNRLFGTSHKVEDYSNDWTGLWQVSQAEAERRREIWLSSKDWRDRHDHLLEGALEVLNHLKKNHELVVVTGRSKRVMEYTQNWINQRFPNLFKKVYFAGLFEEGRDKSKGDACREAGAAYMIEDDYQQALDCAKSGVTVLLFGDYAWNRSGKLPKGVTRVKNWREVKEYFDAQS